MKEIYKFTAVLNKQNINQGLQVEISKNISQDSGVSMRRVGSAVVKPWKYVPNPVLAELKNGTKVCLHTLQNISKLLIKINILTLTSHTLAEFHNGHLRSNGPQHILNCYYGLSIDC